MTTRFLACYISGMLAVIAVLLWLVTFVPEAELKGRIAQGVCFGLAGGFAVLGRICGQRSPEHWINRSLLLQGVLAMLAAGITWLILLGVIG